MNIIEKLGFKFIVEYKAGDLQKENNVCLTSAVRELELKYNEAVEYIINCVQYFDGSCSLDKDDTDTIKYLTGKTWEEVKWLK